MSQELIQENKKKQLTFEEMCPMHSSILSNWDNLTHKQQYRELHILVSDGKRCIVGEAHGFRGYGADFPCCIEYGGADKGFPKAVHTINGVICDLTGNFLKNANRHS